MVKKKIPLILALGAFMAMGHVSLPASSGMKEVAEDYENNNGVGLHVLRAEGGEISYSDTFAQYGMKDGKYVLRFATAIKGDFKSLVYKRDAIEGAEPGSQQATAASKEVSVLYKSIKTANGSAYYNGEEVVYESSEATEGWYWACYSITYTSDTFYDTPISVKLVMNDQPQLGKKKTISLSELIGEKFDYYLDEKHVNRLGGSNGDISDVSEDESVNARDNIAMGNLNDNRGATLTWFVESNKNTTAEVILNTALGVEEYGANIIKAGVNFDIFVNGQAIDYLDKSLELEGDPWVDFREYQISSSVNLNEGYNTIVLKINDKFGNLDYVKLVTDANLEIKDPKEIVLEAENALKADGKNNNMSLQNDGTVIGDLDSNAGASLSWTVNADDVTPVAFAMKLAVGNYNNHLEYSLTITNSNGTKSVDTNVGDLRNIDNWLWYNNYSLNSVGELAKGENTITLTVLENFGNLDCIKLVTVEQLSEVSATTYTHRLEAEVATKMNGTGTMYPSDDGKMYGWLNDNIGATFTWKVNAEEVTTVGFRMSLAVEGEQTSQFNIAINGKNINISSLNISGESWDIPHEYKLDAIGLLNKGENSIVLTINGNFGNLDYIDLLLDRELAAASYVFEAENASRTVGQVEENRAEASNGKNVGYLNGETGDLTWTFIADKEASAELYLSIAYGMDYDYWFDWENGFTIIVNGIEYAPNAEGRVNSNIPGKSNGGDWNIFFERLALTGITLQEGENTITFRDLGSMGNLDYMKLVTSAKIG